MGKIRFTVSAGILMRRGIISRLKAYCFSRGLAIEVDEEKGFFDSDYFVTITGDYEALRGAADDIRRWSDKLSTE